MMKEIFDNLIAEPMVAQNTNPGPVSYRKAKALLLLEGRAVLQIEAHVGGAVAPDEMILQLTEAKAKTKTGTRKSDVRPPSHWGLNE
jgi:hypothetical protein